MTLRRLALQASLAALSLVIGVVLSHSPEARGVLLSGDAGSLEGATDDPLPDTVGPVLFPTLDPEQRDRLSKAATLSPIVTEIANEATIEATDVVTWTNDQPPIHFLGAAVTLKFEPAISIDADVPAIAFYHPDRETSPYVRYELHVVGEGVSSVLVFVDMEGNVVSIVADSDAKSRIISQKIVGDPTLPESNED
jgi:hypothetical protein